MRNVIVPFTSQSDKLNHLKVTWVPGSKRLTLVSNNGRIIADRTHYSYSSAEGAEAGAMKWFRLIERMFV